MEFNHVAQYDLAITSPPYMNGLGYVINYKIEMGWLGFGQNHKRYSNDWIEKIKHEIAISIQKRGSYRRRDMPEIVHKYFDDMQKIMKNVVSSLKPGGRFIQVVGDSLIADVYLPTDLILAKIGAELGLKIESIEKARNRRSGQIRTYQLRETVITLKKE